MKTNKPFKLDEYSRKDSFRVPDNYFEDFSKGMEEYVAQNRPARKVSFNKRFRPYLYVAASLVIAITVTFTLFNMHAGNTDSNLLADNHQPDSTLIKIASAVKPASNPQDTSRNVKAGSKKVNLSEINGEEDDDDIYDEVFGDEDEGI
jgi:uncharacterized membrane protein YdfJ with MMPL/SSD domain